MTIRASESSKNSRLSLEGRLASHKVLETLNTRCPNCASQIVRDIRTITLKFPAQRETSVMGIFRCAVKRRWSTAGEKDPPGNWIAPPGNNRSGGGGNKAVEASGVEGR